MNQTKPLYFLLPLFLSVLACTLTAKTIPQGNTAAMVANTAKATQSNPATVTTTLMPMVQACRVTTGLPDGRLNLRACSGIDCPIVTTVNEGETLFQTQAVDGWLAVKTAGGLIGWVNSQFTNCKNEVTK